MQYSSLLKLFQMRCRIKPPNNNKFPHKIRHPFTEIVQSQLHIHTSEFIDREQASVKIQKPVCMKLLDNVLSIFLWQGPERIQPVQFGHMLHNSQKAPEPATIQQEEHKKNCYTGCAPVLFPWHCHTFLLAQDPSSAAWLSPKFHLE